MNSLPNPSPTIATFNFPVLNVSPPRQLLLGMLRHKIHCCRSRTSYFGNPTKYQPSDRPCRPWLSEIVTKSLLLHYLRNRQGCPALSSTSERRPRPASGTVILPRTEGSLWSMSTERALPFTLTRRYPLVCQSCGESGLIWMFRNFTMSGSLVVTPVP